MKHSAKSINTSLADGLRAVASQLPSLADKIAYSHEMRDVKPINTPVAYFYGSHVLCPECFNEVQTAGTSRTAIYRENIGQYAQDCHRCGDVLVEGNPGWPRLFENPDAASNVQGSCWRCNQYGPLVVPVGKSPLSNTLRCVPCTNEVAK